jgi:predicted MFS family arabinose efflux permease
MIASRWTALAVLTFARTAMGFQFQVVGALGPLLMPRFGVGNVELGLLVGLFSLPGVVLALAGGVLGARFGDRRVALVGLSLMATGTALMGVAGTFAVATAGRFAAAVGAVLLNVLVTKMVADWFAGREIVWAMAVMINAWPIGIGLALFTLPAVARSWGVAAAIHVAAGLAAAGALALAALYRPAPGGSAPAAGAGLAGLSRREAVSVSVAALPWMLYNAGYAIMLGFVPIVLVQRGWSVADAGLVLGINTVLVIVSVQAGGAAAQWWPRAQTAIITLGLVCGFVILVLLPHVAPVLPLMVGGVLVGLPAAALIAAPTLVLKPESRGPGMGLFYTWYYAGMAVLPAVAGWLADALGRAAAPTFAGCVMLATLPAYLAFRATLSGASDSRSPR